MKRTNRLTAIGKKINALKGTSMSLTQYNTIQQGSDQTYAMHVRQLKNNNLLNVYAD